MALKQFNSHLKHRAFLSCLLSSLLFFTESPKCLFWVHFSWLYNSSSWILNGNQEPIHSFLVPINWEVLFLFLINCVPSLSVLSLMWRIWILSYILTNKLSSVVKTELYRQIFQIFSIWSLHRKSNSSLLPVVIICCIVVSFRSFYLASSYFKMLHLDLTGAKKLDHIIPIMASLHFVPFHLRIKFKMYK